MPAWMKIAIALLLIVGIPGCWAASAYNGLQREQVQVDTSWAQVQNVYQRRADLVPNLVETVKGYAAHEQKTLEDVGATGLEGGQQDLTMGRIRLVHESGLGDRGIGHRQADGPGGGQGLLLAHHQAQGLLGPGEGREERGREKGEGGRPAHRGAF